MQVASSVQVRQPLQRRPARQSLPPAAVAAPTTDPTATGIADTGAAASSGLAGLGVPAGLAGALPYLAAGGAGLAEASGAANTHQA